MARKKKRAKLGQVVVLNRDEFESAIRRAKDDCNELYAHAGEEHMQLMCRKGVEIAERNIHNKVESIFRSIRQRRS